MGSTEALRAGLLSRSVVQDMKRDARSLIGAQLQILQTFPVRSERVHAAARPLPLPLEPLSHVILSHVIRAAAYPWTGAER